VHTIFENETGLQGFSATHTIPENEIGFSEIIVARKNPLRGFPKNTAENPHK